MKKNKAKKVVLIIAIIVLLFGIYNLLWYFTTQSKYTNYSEGMDEFVANKSYVLNPGNGYLYNVKYPDYLTFTGNLAVADENNEVSLIIWPSFYGEDEYGIRITTNDDSYEIMIDKDMKSVENNDILDKYKKEIRMLFQKADEKWGIMH